MLVRNAVLFDLLGQLRADNAAGELYMTDVVALAREAGLKTRAAELDQALLAGVNSRADLAAVEAQLQQRLRAAVMEAGVTLIAPETVTLCYDTVIGADTVVEPNVFFGPGVSIGTGCRLRAGSYFEGASVGEGVIIGPMARLREGSQLDQGVKVGNFVEIKKAHLAAGAKAPHLTYVGDAEVGEQANLGAGTITCNYDGVNKHQTTIGPGAFIGSNAALVAPVSIGAGAIVGAGSTVTEDVADDAIITTRAPAPESGRRRALSQSPAAAQGAPRKRRRLAPRFRQTALTRRNPPPHVWHHRYSRTGRGRKRPARRAASARIPGLRQRRDRDAGQRPHRPPSAEGKLRNLADVVQESPLPAALGSDTPAGPPTAFRT